MECSCGGTFIHCKCTRGALCEMNQSLASALKLNAMICLRRNALHLIVCLLMCVEDAANEALLARETQSIACCRWTMLINCTVLTAFPPH